MQNSWQATVVAEDETYHLLNSKPFYQQKFIKVLKYHAPGLAPVVDHSGAYHINKQGFPVYTERYQQTFGFYEGLAAVEEQAGWMHIDVKGQAAYSHRFAWCGNFQESLCPVKDKISNYYYHVNQNGQRIYSENYHYVGDYRDGIAVVCNKDGLHTHIDKKGNYIHNNWFLGLDVFHKSVARAKDKYGWFHINKLGEPLYTRRFKVIEPFYNNIAHVEDFVGNLFTINIAGESVTIIYQAQPNYLHELSADLVGFWKTQTIFAAVQLKILDVLPNDSFTVAHAIGLDIKICKRFLRALAELKLVEFVNEKWILTAKGKVLTPVQSSSMAAAAKVWSEAHYQQWTQLTHCLLNPQAQAENYFNLLAQDESQLSVYQRALSGYALHDYEKITTVVDWSQHKVVIDAGGGTGILLHHLLNNFQHLQGILLELPAVINLISKHARCQYLEFNLLQTWPVRADAVLLARVLHDWNDEQATVILKHARASLQTSGKIYLLEMILPTDAANGGLLDMNMLVMTGGCERTLSDWQHLVDKAQLRIMNTISLSSIVNLIILIANDD